MRSRRSSLTGGRAIFLKPVAIGLLAWAALAAPQPTPEAEAAAVLERGRKAALEYVHSLPDFVCTEVIRRYAAPNDRSAGLRFEDWRLNDTLTVQLGYFEGKEQHKLTLIDGNPADQTYESVGGSVGSGEFGGMMYSIFDPSSAATFRWGKWKNVRRRRAAVYSYEVQQPHSRYLLVSRGSGSPLSAVVGFHGELEVDRETGAVLRLTYVADRIPKELRLDSAVTTVVYDFTDVGGRSYLLPANSETVLEGPRESTRNHMDFRNYGKFSSESFISFGDAK